MQQIKYLNKTEIEFVTTEKEYQYKTGWGNILLLTVLGVLGILAGVNSFFKDNMFLNYLGFIMAIFLFLMVAVLLLRNINSIDKVLIAKDNIYIPRPFSFTQYVEISFLGIDSIEIVEISGNTIFQIGFQKKQYSVPHSMLSSPEEFQEIVEFVAQKVRPEILDKPFEIIL